MARLTTKTLLAQTRGAIVKQVDTLREELSALRRRQVTQGGSGKSGEIKVVRKNIARALTVANLKRRQALLRAYKGKAVRPADLYAKKTRAIRRALSKTDAARQTVRQQKRSKYFPIKKFALKA